MANKTAPAQSWRDDPAIEEYLALLDRNNPDAKSEMQALLWQVMQMEQELKTTTRELASLRKELAEAQEPKVKRMLTKAVAGLEQSLAALKARIDTLKTAILDGCKKAVSAVREQGVSVLADTTRFFRVGPMLEAVGREAERAAAMCDRGLAAVEQQTANYHEAGRRVRNAGRALLGQEPVKGAKGAGRLALTLEEVYKREKAVFGHVAGRVETALTHYRDFEQAAHHKPSIRETMKKLNEKISREQRDKPAPTVEHEGR